MIFVTVGSQLPFNRLISVVDDWAALNPENSVFGQIGDVKADDHVPRNFKWESYLSPTDFQSRMSEATLVVAHAGMGSIISALSDSTPLVILPRRSVLKETRNDHQIATARAFSEKRGIYVAFDENELGGRIDEALSEGPLPSKIIGFAEPRLLDAIKELIHTTNAQAPYD